MASIIDRGAGKSPRKPSAVRYRHEGRQRQRSFRTKGEVKDFVALFEYES